MATALITGVSGFCGRHLVARLKREVDLQIMGADLRPQPSGELDLGECLPLDIRNFAEVLAMVRRWKPDFVFHLAGVIAGTAISLYQTNFIGGVNLLEALKQAAPEARLLMVGSAAEYGFVPAAEMPISEDHACNPSGGYALSKYALSLAALDYARKQGLNVVVVRPFNIIGPGIPPSLLVGAILGRVRKAWSGSGEVTVEVGNLDTERDFIAVSDAVEAYVRLVLGNHRGEVFNICSGKPRRIRAVVEELLSFSPYPIHLRVDPALVRPDDVASVYGSWEKANRAVGFKPSASLTEALQAAWSYEMERNG